MRSPWYQIGNLGSFVNSFYPMQDITTGSLFNHNNYCGTFAVLLAVLFLFLKKPSRKLRIKYLVMVLFLAACLNNAGLNYVFHGFSIPHGLGNRFAFILLFFILIAAYICLLNAKNFTYKQVLFFIWNRSCRIFAGTVFEYRKFESVFLCGSDVVCSCVFGIVYFCAAEKYSVEYILYLGDRSLDDRSSPEWLCGCTAKR